MLASDGLGSSLIGSPVSVTCRRAPAAIASAIRKAISAPCPPRRRCVVATAPMPSQASSPARNRNPPPTTSVASVIAYVRHAGRPCSAAIQSAMNGGISKAAAIAATTAPTCAGPAAATVRSVAMRGASFDWRSIFAQLRRGGCVKPSTRSCAGMSDGVPCGFQCSHQPETPACR